MTEAPANGQGEVTTTTPSSTEGKTATSPVESSTTTTTEPSSVEEKKDVKQETSSDKKVPYSRFSEVVREKAMLEAEIKTLKEQKTPLTDKQIERIKEYPEEIKRLFGEENAEEGYNLFNKLLQGELTKFQQKQLEEIQKKEQQERENLEYVENETARVVKDYSLDNPNNFKKFIEEHYKKKGFAYWNRDNKLDFDAYAELYQSRPQATADKSQKDLEKVSGKTTSKTETKVVFTPKDLRNF